MLNKVFHVIQQICQWAKKVQLFSQKLANANIKKSNKSFGPIPRGAPKIYQTYNDAPESPGLYRFHCPKCKAPTYIGQTINIRRRFYQHFKRGDKRICPSCNGNTVFKAQLASDCFDHENLIDSERKQIRKHRPGLNKRTGGGGRRPEK